MDLQSSFWCDQSLLVTVRGPQGEITFPVNQPFARIGSHEKSEVRLAGLEARSLYLHATAEGVFCVRLQPEDGGIVGSGIWLAEGEQILAGSYRISAKLRGALSGPSPRLALTAWGSAAPPLPVCEIGGNEKFRDKRRFRARLNLVGRRRELALQMLGLQVSSCHCALYWDAGSLWCIDLLSSNGTLRNGEPIDCACLQLGDTLTIGEFSLKFKRLSRSTPRQSSWRTGDSDEDVISYQSDDQLTETRQRSTAATSAVTEMEVSPVTESSPPEATALVPPVVQELAAFEQQLWQQRQQLDEQWQQTKGDVVAQVNQLQQESALLAKERVEMAKLRAEYENQRLLLAQDLKAMQDASKRPELEVAGSLASDPGTQPLDDESLVLPPAESSDDVDSATKDAANESKLSPASDERTTLESNSVVEHESQPEQIQHIDSLEESLNQSPEPVAPARRSSALKGASFDSRLTPVDLETLVAERLGERDGAQRFWLRMLWGVAAVAALAALAALAYVALSNP